MKVILFSLVLPILILSFFGCSRKTSMIVEGIREAAERAKPERKACDAFSGESSPAESANYELPNHASRENALAILAFLERRPLKHEFLDRMRSPYLVNLAHLAEQPNQAELSELYANSGAACGIFHMLHLPPLLGDQTKYNFSAVERARAEKVARTFLQEDLDLPNSALKRLVQAVVLKRYVMLYYKGADKQWLIEELQAIADRFEVERHEITARARDAEILHGKNSVLKFEYEHTVMRRMTSEYARLLKRVFNKKA